MASSIQLLRSATTQERPTASNLLDGQPAVNTNAAEPGLFFKASDGSLVKVGPTAITTDGAPPNASAIGSTGNSIGEMWLDKSLDPPVLKVYDGAAWVEAGSGDGGGGSVTLLRWTKTALGGETSLSGVDDSGQPLNYIPGLEQLYLNGVLLERGDDYVGTNETSFTNLSPLTAGDVVMVLAYSPFNIVNIPDDSIDGSKLIDGTVTIAKLDSLSSSAIDYDLGVTGSESRSVGDKLKESVSVLDFIPESEHANIRAGTDFPFSSTVYDSSPAIQAAIDFCIVNGYSLHIPSGSYALFSPIYASDARGNSLLNIYGDGNTLTRLHVNHDEPFAFHFGPKGLGASYNNTLRDFILIGKYLFPGQTGNPDQVGFVVGRYTYPATDPNYPNQTWGSNNGYAIDNVTAHHLGIGWSHLGLQFCEFRSQKAYQCRIGMVQESVRRYVGDSSDAGGGNNNTWRNCYYWNCNVGIAFIRSNFVSAEVSGLDPATNEIILSAPLPPHDPGNVATLEVGDQIDITTSETGPLPPEFYESIRLQRPFSISAISIDRTRIKLQGPSVGTTFNITSSSLPAADQSLLPYKLLIKPLNYLPLHSNTFENLTTHNCGQCYFSFEHGPATINCWAPEEIGGGLTESYVTDYYGTKYYARPGMTHLVRSFLYLENYLHVNIGPPNIGAFLRSTVGFENAGGAETNVTKDDSSIVTHGTSCHGVGGGSDAVVSDNPFPRYNGPFSLFTEPNIVENIFIPNNSRDVNTSPFITHLNGKMNHYSGMLYQQTPTVPISFPNVCFTWDEEMGLVLSVKNVPVGQGYYIRTGFKDADITDKFVSSLLFKVVGGHPSSGGSSLEFSVNNNNPNKILSNIPTDKWIRYTATGLVNYGDTSTYLQMNYLNSNIGVTVSPEIRICRIMGFLPENDQQMGRIIRDNYYNPGKFFGGKYFSDSPPDGTWFDGTAPLGALIYNNNPVPGGSVGWVCTTSGNPGTWKPFGTISL